MDKVSAVCRKEFMTAIVLLSGGVGEDILNELFADAPEKGKKPKTVKCPHCGEVFEI